MATDKPKEEPLVGVFYDVITDETIVRELTDDEVAARIFQSSISEPLTE